MEIFANKGADLKALSPKPSVKSAITPKTKPDQIADTAYNLRLDMKGFGLNKVEWDYLTYYLESPPVNAKPNTGMWLDHSDPIMDSIRWSGPYDTPSEPDCEPGYGCYGGVRWWYYNSAENCDTSPEGLLICLPPASTKALFDPSSVSFRYVRSELNQPDPVVPGRPLYDFGLSIGYLHKGISFITGGEITMSGAPEDIRVTHGPLDVYSELYLYGEYPTIEFA